MIQFPSLQTWKPRLRKMMGLVQGHMSHNIGSTGVGGGGREGSVTGCFGCTEVFV